MKNFSKIILGALLASTLLLSVPAQEAHAASATLTKKFYYELDGAEWEYEAIDPHTNPYLVSESNTNNLAISYIQFLIDPAAVNANGSLGLTLHDVSTSPDSKNGFLSIYRVNDQAVFDASGDLNTADVGTVAPLALGTLLSTLAIDDTNDNDTLLFNFAHLVNSAPIGSNQYLSFAIVADINTATWIRAEQDPNTVHLSVTTPAPEPMSVSYMLIGCCAFLLRRIKSLFGLA